jgi:dTDP-D-glucose 4,6-dehydratase
MTWLQDDARNPPEASYLMLDSAKAQAHLGWRPVWDLAQALERIVQWHRAHRSGEDMREVTLGQVAEFVEDAADSGARAQPPPERGHVERPRGQAPT